VLEVYEVARFCALPTRVPGFMLGPLRAWLHTALQTAQPFSEAQTLALWQRLCVQHPIAVVAEAQYRAAGGDVIFLDALVAAHPRANFSRDALELALLAPTARDVAAASEKSVLLLLARFVPELRAARRETLLVVRRLTDGVRAFCAHHGVALSACLAPPQLAGAPGVWAPFERVGPPRCDAVRCTAPVERAEEPRACSRCKRAFYCGAECQKRAWRDHKAECAVNAS
jgi:hypothetical protein